MSQSFPASAPRSDRVYLVGRQHVPIARLRPFIREYGINAARIVKMEIDVGMGLVELGLLPPGHVDLGTKTSLPVIYFGSTFIADIIRARGLLFFEGTPSLLHFKDLADVIEAMATVKDAKTDREIADLYTPVPAVPVRLMQSVLWPDCEKTISVLNPSDTGGIASIRYLKGLDCLVGVLVDSRGEGMAIAVLSQLHAENPKTLRDPSAWRIIARQIDGPIETLGRPRLVSEDRIHVVVKLAGGCERNLAIVKEGPAFSCVWGEQIRTERTSIGVVNGTEALFASYVSEPEGAHITFEPVDDADPVSSSHIQH